MQSDQYSTGPSGGRFFQCVEFHLPELAARMRELERAFATEAAPAIGATFRLREASTPTRVALFVSRYDHCLPDLVWRARRGELPMPVVQVISNHTATRCPRSRSEEPSEVPLPGHRQRRLKLPR